MKSIKIENYIKLLLILVLIICVALFIRNIYTKGNNKSIDSYFANNVSKVLNYNEVDNFLKENDTIILYISDRNIDNSNLEEELINIVKENELEDDFVYVDITKVKDKIKYMEKFNNEYDIEGVLEYPALVYFKNGNIQDVLFTNLDKNTFEMFIERNEMK